MTLIKLIGLLTWLIMPLATADAQGTAVGEKSPGLEMRLETIKGAEYSVGHLPFAIIFENKGPQKIRILNVFEVRANRVFFSFVFRDDKDTPILWGGGGKIDLPQNGYRYTELGEDSQLKVDLDISTFFRRDSKNALVLPPGKYRVFLTYSNQYGKDCFQGTLEAKPIDLILK